MMVCRKTEYRNNPYWIVPRIAIQVQTVDGFGIQVGGVIRGDKSSPLGGVIPGVAIIQAGIVIVVIAAVADGVGIGDRTEGFLLERMVVGQRSRRLNFALCTLHFALNSWCLPCGRTAG